MDSEDDDEDCKRAAQARKGSPFLNTAQAAHYLGLSERKLEAMRISGEGPVYRKHATCVRYHIKDLELWSDTTKRTGTQERDSPDDDAPQS